MAPKADRVSVVGFVSSVANVSLFMSGRPTDRGDRSQERLIRPADVKGCNHSQGLVMLKNKDLYLHWIDFVSDIIRIRIFVTSSAREMDCLGSADAIVLC